MSLSAIFSRAQAENRAALIVYITAGDPSLAATVDLALALGEAGADLVELGIPYSDPLADGPIIQAAGQRALAAGTTVAGVLEAARKISVGQAAGPSPVEGPVERRTQRVRLSEAGPSASPPPALLLMTCFNPVLQYGPERFAEEASAAGVSAVLISDLPPEEAGEWREIAARHSLETVFLVTPVSEPERLALACEASTGFVYVVSRAGTTGVRQDLPPELPDLLRRLRGLTDRPLAVGFGVSRPEHVAAVARIADGAIVGSAIVRVIGELGAGGEMLSTVSALVHDLAKATHRM